MVLLKILVLEFVRTALSLKRSVYESLSAARRRGESRVIAKGLGGRSLVVVKGLAGHSLVMFLKGSEGVPL